MTQYDSQDQPVPADRTDSSSDSNSDSGIGFRDPVTGVAREVEDLGLAGPPEGLAMAAPSASNDNSFNSEMLESQNSAENLRQSMQRWVKLQ